MDNKVGDNTPATAELVKIVKSVEDTQGRLRKFCVGLLPEERQLLTRPKRGIEEHLTSIAELAKKLGLSIPGASPDSILNDLRTDRDLAAVEQALEVALDLVRDTRALARSEASEVGFMYYGILQGAGDRIPEVRAQVRTFAEFMATGRRRKPAGDDNKPSGG
ncbi:MAG: hypothetical protein JNM83_13875 [Myxococcales bacterium]|jgi:hypothetical protein|nr:hypothetical protein [Myxococcales bacterium]